MSVWLLGKRFTKHFVYMLPICLFAAYANIITNALVFSSELNDAEWNIKKFLHIMYEFIQMDGDFCGFVLFFSPSLTWPLFVYSAIYLVGKAVYCTHRFDLTVEHTTVTLTGYVLAYFGSALFLYYMVQMRELARFSQQ